MTGNNGTDLAQGQFFNQVMIQAGDGTGHAASPLEQLFASHVAEVMPPFSPQGASAPVQKPILPQQEPALTTPPRGQEMPSPRGTVAELTAEYEWLHEERKRLEAYTINQFALITKQKEELASRRAGVEAAFALREQEINRQLKILAERAEIAEQRERKLAQQESTLALATEETAKVEQLHQQLEKANSKLQKEIDDQRLHLQHLRFQAGQLEESVRAAKAELIAFERMQENQKKAHEEDQTQFQARQEQLDRRFKRLEQAEGALQRREQELEELEAQLRCEIEQREQELANQHRELEKLQAELRCR